MPINVIVKWFMGVYKMAPARSQAQQKLMAIAKSIKEGETPSSYSPSGAKAAKSMTMGDLRDYAHKPKGKELPYKKKKSKKKSSMPPMKGGMPHLEK